MRVIRGLQSARFSGVVLTIGGFDGVHRGHAEILAAGRRQADVAGTQLVVMTFEPHPAAILTPDCVPATLTPPAEKFRCLEHGGADVVVVVRSRPEFFNITAEEFIAQIVQERFAPIAMIEGPSFKFGQHRRGDVDTLRKAAQIRGFEVVVVEPIRAALGGHPDTVVSSSLVRHLLSSGTVYQAALCLGRPYTLIGRVTKGSGRGKPLGFPTANIVVGSQLIPAEGVYAGRAEIEGEYYAAAISIGRTTTFEIGGNVVVEAHLLDFKGDLYEQPIRLELLDWIRNQQKFDSSKLLCKQIERDITHTRKVYQEQKQ